jgi:alpha-amylase/alpha-mannosidase (GH57 family)
VAASRFLTIHGHFYQPPRENPWLEAVEVQDSAAPSHDWNERVTAECYAPNTAARRLGPDNRILDVVNNFEKISFNVGPTLLAWLERQAPAVYARILEADRESVVARDGHGNAIAQVYNHMIMPLASRRDKVTQVRWGLADFRTRFGREPEGMWLPEAAVDDETLEVLAEEGLRFTILSPGQARRIRSLAPEEGVENGAEWDEVGERIDPSRAYLWRGPRGLALALFFYDGPISRGIAFENLLDRGEYLVDRLRQGFSDARPWPQLVHCATDGESYGHHHAFGDMALAAAVAQIETEGSTQLTNYGAFLAAHPPTHEVEIAGRTSWSCGHGVERWRADCGCRFRAGTQQRWRGPLREALDWLRDRVDAFYAARAATLLRDPWMARDAYVDVVLDRSPARLEKFLTEHQRGVLDAEARVDVRRLLELERNRLLMYTSCGWFFDEISGIEPVQILRYAALTLQYLRDLGGEALEGEFVRRLEAAPSNVPDLGHGGEVYRRHIRPAVVDLRRVVAHYAISGLFEDYPEEADIYAYRVRRLDEARESYGGTTLRVGRVRVVSEVTGDAREAMYAMLHFGGHDFTCAVRPWEDADRYDAIKDDLLARYAHYTVPDMIRGMDQHFPGEHCSLGHLFLEERRRVLTRVIRAVLDTQEETYRRIWEENRKLVWYLRQQDAPIPEALALVARHVLGEQALAALAETPTRGAIPSRAFDLADEASALGLTLDLKPGRPALRQAILEAIDRVATTPAPEDVERGVALVEGARRLGVPFSLWNAQNRFFETWRANASARSVLSPLAAALGFSVSTEPGQ